MSATWFPWAFWVIAVAASAFYGLFAVTIFTKASEGLNRPWLVHQVWVNFLGALTGWLSAWLLILRHCGWPISSCSWQPDRWDLIGAFVAFIGMTGYLPFTALGLVNGLRTLSAKADDVLAKLLPKSGGS